VKLPIFENKQLANNYDGCVAIATRIDAMLLAKGAQSGRLMLRRV
jgi:hypothetical protein